MSRLRPWDCPEEREAQPQDCAAQETKQDPQQCRGTQPRSMDFLILAAASAHLPHRNLIVHCCQG